MLVKLDERYYIKNDGDKSFSLCTKTESVDKEGNKITSYPSEGYYTSIDKAVLSYCNKRAMTSEASTFKEFLKEYNQAKNNVEKLFN